MNPEHPPLLRRILAAPFLLLIHAYRLLISPVLHALTGPLGGGCRFQPTCSQYALEALRVHPLPRALGLIFWRILRCNPWGGCGPDPVPAPLKSPDQRKRKEVPIPEPDSEA